MEMRIVLRKPDDCLYLQASGEWACSREGARSFESVLVAFTWARDRKLAGLEILFCFSDCKYDLVSVVTE